jgi:hypothetical protein
VRFSRAISHHPMSITVGYLEQYPLSAISA